MKKIIRQTALPLLPLLFLFLPFKAFAIHKCTSNGTVSYSELPCPSGTSETLKEPPPPDNPAAATQEIARQKTQGNRLEKERLKREEKEDKLQEKVSRAAAAKQKKCAGLNLHKKWAEEDANKANEKTIAKVKQKAQRAAEKYSLECGA